jgi:ferredoxin-NADP reductase
MDEPRMPALLTSSGRPGFYFRVLQEGDVEAGDAIVKVGEAQERMSVTDVNALLYLPGHSREQLERALRMEALSPGWRASFEALLQSHTSGNAGLVPEAVAHPPAPGFRALCATAIERESADVLSVTLQSADAAALPEALPGQYVVLRLQPRGDDVPLFRSYSLSGPASTERYRISVKIEAAGVAGLYLEKRLKVGDTIQVSAPRGNFILPPGDDPVVLLSAGIGVTPVLAMLHALSAQHSSRPVLWLHAARDGAHYPFGAEVSRLMLPLTQARRYICFSQPRPEDVPGKSFDAAGHLSAADFAALGLSQEAQIYLCGPNRFMDDMKAILGSQGMDARQIHTEIFSGSPTRNPGVVSVTARTPHLPPKQAQSGPLVSFARSSIAVHWQESAYQSLLELAEACDVPVRWSCRSGVCHNCESGLVSGDVDYRPDPLERPADGNVLLCCSRPTRDVVLDL